MEEKAQFGIGFVSGRPNVCAVINNTYKHLLNQTKKFDREVELTIFILYDLSYQKESREEDFYKINGIPLKNKTKKFANKYEFPEEIDKNSQIYANEFVITGTLEKLSRKDCTDIIIGLGGTVKDRISKSTNYLILGNNDYNPILNGEKSHKQKDAEKAKLNGQNIDIISENVFYDMIEDYIKIQ